MKRGLGYLLIGISWVCAVGWIVLGIAAFLWALALWNTVAGLFGVIIGFFLISDVALPFVYHAGTGDWPWPWLLAVAAVLACRLIGQGAESAGNALVDAATAQKVQHG